MASFLETATRAAKEAGGILLNRFGSDMDFDYKERGDVVSMADRESESGIIRIIEGGFPEHSIFAEESRLRHKKSEFLWVIDPLDGTSNFLLGIPYFSVSIALIKNNEIVLGVVYCPVSDKLYHAERGKGAFLNGKRLKVKPKGELDKFIVSLVVGSPSPLLARDAAAKLTGRVYRILTNWSPALDFCMLAEGKIDAVISLKTEMEDHPAGILIAREAGAVARYFDGSEFRLESFTEYLDNMITINNEKMFNKILEIIR